MQGLRSSTWSGLWSQLHHLACWLHGRRLVRTDHGLVRAVSDEEQSVVPSSTAEESVDRMAKQRRSRSGMPESAVETSAMSREALDAEIARCLWGYENGGTSQSRKSFFNRLVWYEAEREALFGVEAERRRFS